jgi:hypothetical protein
MTNTEKVRAWRAKNPERNAEINRKAQRYFRQRSMQTFKTRIAAVEIIDAEEE